MIPTGITIHHSLTKDGKTVDWDAIKRYHIENNHWTTIGYHAGVERINGVLTTLTGRAVNRIGAHCVGRNDTIGICIVGNFDIGPPDDEILEYAAKVTAGYLRMFALPITSVRRHNEFAPKSCPGKKFPWDKFIGLVVSNA